jgi:hypothetical protein
MNQISIPHGKRDATSWYETHDPEFLRECVLATNMVIEKLNNLMKRDLVPPNVRHKCLLTGNHKKYGRVA